MKVKISYKEKELNQLRLIIAALKNIMPIVSIKGKKEGKSEYKRVYIDAEKS